MGFVDVFFVAIGRKPSSRERILWRLVLDVSDVDPGLFFLIYFFASPNFSSLFSCPKTPPIALKMHTEDNNNVI